MVCDEFRRMELGMEKKELQIHTFETPFTEFIFVDSHRNIQHISCEEATVRMYK